MGTGMTILRAFSTAIKRAMREMRMSLLLYVLNLLAAAGLAIAFRSVVSTGLDSSMSISELLGNLDFNVWQDFMVKHGHELSGVFNQIVWLALLYMLVNTFLAGGILSLLRAKETKFSLASFFSGCGTYFFRFFRLFVIFGILLVLIALILMALLGIVYSVVAGGALSEVTVFVWWIILAAVFLFVMMIVIMVDDYAKVIVVTSDVRSMLKTAWRSAGFVFRHFLGTVGLQLLMLVVPVVLFAIYVWLDLSIGMASVGTILLMFVLQQLFIFLRVWTRVFFFSGELGLYEALARVDRMPDSAGAGTSRGDVQPAAGGTGLG
jgi:hypothetical protein